MNKGNDGLTLIEVLIALAIIAIAITAVIKATAQSIRTEDYLQTKMSALWVGQNVMNEVLVGLRKLPEPPDQFRDEVQILNKRWYVRANLADTPNAHIKEIDVHVYQNDADDAPSLLDLVSYLYASP